MIFVLFLAAKAMNDTTEPVNNETFKMKKARMSADKRTPTQLPTFLRGHEGDTGLVP